MSVEQTVLNGKVLVGGCADREEYDTRLLYFICSSLSQDDGRIYTLTDRTGSPNVMVWDMVTGEERILTDNREGTPKSYVYFDGDYNQGLGKASVCLGSVRDIVYYIRDDKICKAGLDGKSQVLSTVPDGRTTAFTHISSGGKLLCMPMTDGRCLGYNPEMEGNGLDKWPVYDIDGRCQEENLSSYLCVYDTDSGELLYEKEVPKCWITHVQFSPRNSEQVMYNREWSSFDCGIRRIWLYDHNTDTVARIRTEGNDTLGSPAGYERKAEDWVCHEMWSDDGRTIIYHGGYVDGPATVGRYEPESGKYWKTVLPKDYDAYGYFTMDSQGNLVRDSYFKYPWEVKKVRENSTDNSPDPHKKDTEYIRKVVSDWESGTLTWIPLCRHESGWPGQDAHSRPIYSHAGDRVFFNGRMGATVNVYCVSARTPL